MMNFARSSVVFVNRVENWEPPSSPESQLHSLTLVCSLFKGCDHWMKKGKAVKRQTVPTILTALILAVLLVFVSNWSQSNLYAVQDVGECDPADSYSFSLPAVARIAGYMGPLPETRGRGLFHNTGRTMSGVSNAYSKAYSINAHGLAVGAVSTADGSVHVGRFANGKVEDLGTLGGVKSNAYAVNAAGDTVGASLTANGNRHAFLYANGRLLDLGAFGGGLSEAHDINANDQVVGFSQDCRGCNHAFLYSDGTMQDLGTLGGAHSFAFGVNNAGQVVGYSDTTDGATHAFLYQNSAMQDLGTLPQGMSSYAYGVNTKGEVVGGADAANGVMHAFLYKNGRMHDLNRLISPRSGWLLQEARAINERGQIAGIGTFAGKPRAFLLTPQ